MTRTPDSMNSAPGWPQRYSMVKVGGSLGISATCIALAVFVAGLFGLNAAFLLSPLAVGLGGIGLIVTIVGGVIGRHAGEEETQPISALFVCAVGLIGGLLELYAWLNFT